METEMSDSPAQPADYRSVVRSAIEEFFQAQQTKKEPAYQAELLEERKRREQLERRVNELVEENRSTKKAAEEAERTSTIRTELQRLGVSKVDLAFKAVRDEVQRTEDGRLVARSENGDLPLREYLNKFVAENPELLPGRIAGGSGATAASASGPSSDVDIDKIKPGMSTEDLDRVRQEIARVARGAVKGM